MCPVLTQQFSVEFLLLSSVHEVLFWVVKMCAAMVDMLNIASLPFLTTG